MTNSDSPPINVITLGHVDHGKTTLTAALRNVLAKHFGGNAYADDHTAPAEEENRGGIIINASHIEYNTNLRHYTHTDCPGHSDYIKTLVTASVPANCGILVVTVTDGPRPQTREHILMARQTGIEKIVVFLNKCDLVDDEETLGLIEMEVRQLLSEYDFPGDDLPVVRGSALQALEGDAQ